MASITGFAHTEMKIATEFKSCSVPREHRQKILKEGPIVQGFAGWDFSSMVLFSSTWEPFAPAFFFVLFWDSCSSNLNPNTPESYHVEYQITHSTCL